ncbi:hypothetical protein [Pantanalinema sp. GBBB05]|uniref:hypothetical protein n=1 Tax=Pantanalinema sp. GBBB05 TaxID=2604139 RepID=UPI001DD3850B|nr:hypothetical protein [Pantanalinema sp. GBBB05]
MHSQQYPHNQDLVLGGEQPPPIAGAVLGGIAGLNQRFEQGDVTQKLATLVQAAQHKDGLSLLYRGLEDENLLVRAEAYMQLKAIAPIFPTLPPILQRGIPLKAGDRIYAVYRSSVSYGDDWYYIDAEISEWYHEVYPFYKEHVSGESFSYTSDLSSDNRMHSSDAYKTPNLITYYIDKKAAETEAQTAFLGKFGQLNCNISEIYPDNELEEFDLIAWVETNEVFVEDVLQSWGDSGWAYQARVLTSLHNQRRFDLLREIWEQLGYHPLAFVHEYEIDRPCYLRLAALET